MPDDYQAALEAALHRKIGDPPAEESYPGDYLAFDRALTVYELDKRQTARKLLATLPRTPLNRIGEWPPNGKGD